MISGRIADLRLAWVPVSIQSGSGSWQTLLAIIDTGFTGELALPERHVRQLGLELNDDSSIIPATGESLRVLAGNVQIMWPGRQRQVRVVQAGTHPLLGMRLLWENRITIDAVTDGAVTIDPLGG